MLEIILIVYLSKKITATAKEKGHKHGSYVFMFVIFWIVGEVLGLIVGNLLNAGLGAYLFAILGAAIGALIAFSIVNNLPVRSESDVIDQF